MEPIIMQTNLLFVEQLFIKALSPMLREEYS